MSVSRRPDRSLRGTRRRGLSGRACIVLIVLAGWPVAVADAGMAPESRPRTYHVDASHGDDRHDGLRPESAWRSLERVNRASLMPGDRVRFRRGETWRGQLVPRSGRPGAPILYGAFGDGPKPRLLGSVAMDRPEDWHETAPGIWATAPIRFEPVAVQAELGRRRAWLHHEAGAACSFRREPDRQGQPRAPGRVPAAGHQRSPYPAQHLGPELSRRDRITW